MTTLSFEQTIEDYAALDRYQHLSKSQRRLINRIELVVAAIAIGIHFYFRWFRPAEPNWVPSGEVWFFIILSLIIGITQLKWFYKIRVKAFIKNGKLTNVTGLRNLRLEDDALHIQTDNTESRITWPAFQYLKETKEHFFLFTDGNQAIIIPKRILPLAQEFYDMQSFLDQKIFLKK